MSRSCNASVGTGTRAVLASLALGLALAGAAHADAEKGMAALQAGDYKTALAELNADAATGDTDAMFLLSRLYVEGKGVTADRKTGFEWMEKAAKAGSVRAQGTLGMYFSEGIGTPRDDAKSLEWGRLAAEGGDLISQFIMGVRHDTGTGVPKDPALALQWWTRSANGGFQRAQVMLADVHARRAEAADATPAQAGASRIEAAKWLYIADAPRIPALEGRLAALKQKMTPQDIEAAEAQARDWRPGGAAK